MYPSDLKDRVLFEKFVEANASLSKRLMSLPARLVDDNELDGAIARAIAILKSLSAVVELGIKPLKPMKESAISGARLQLVMVSYCH